MKQQHAMKDYSQCFQGEFRTKSVFHLGKILLLYFVYDPEGLPMLRHEGCKD